MTELGFDKREVSKRLGKNHAYLQQFIKRGSPKVLPDDIRRALAHILRVEEAELSLLPVPKNLSLTESVKNLAVVGEVVAGVWLEEVSFDEPFEHVAVVPDARFNGMRQFALSVRGPSMDKLIREGEFAICVDAIDLGRAPQHDDIVVVTRTRRAGHLRETTLKQVEVHGSRVELWPRSNDPKFQKKIILSKSDDEAVSVEISAYVISVLRPLI